MIHSAQKIKMIKTAELLPNPYQIRSKFDDAELERLAESIKEIGMLSPIIVRRAEKGYEIICGQRRVRAALINRMEEVPAIVIRAGDAECAQLTIIENMHRKNVSLFEEGECFYNLMFYHRIKKEKLIKTLTVDPFYFNDRVRLLSLGEKVKIKASSLNLSKEYLKEILRLRNEEKQLFIIEKIKEEELSLREVREYADKTISEFTRIKSIRENAIYKSTKKEIEKMPLYNNTMIKTVEILRKNGADVEFSQSEDKNTAVFTIKIHK